MSTAAVTGFMLLMFRCSALLLVAPVASARPVPQRVRLALAILLALLTGSALPAEALAVELQGSALFAAVVTETMLGLAVGAGVRAFFEAALAAGQTLGLSAGLGMGAQMDPISGAPSTAVGDLVSITAAGTAVALGLHTDIIAWFCVSARTHPPGTLLGAWDFLDAAVTQGLSAVALAARLSVPVAGAVTTAYVVMGLVGRAVPQMSLQNVGFVIPLLVGGAVLFDGALDIAIISVRAGSAALTTFASCDGCGGL